MTEEKRKWQLRPLEEAHGFRTVAHPPGDEGEVYRLTEEPLPGGFFHAGADVRWFSSPRLPVPTPPRLGRNAMWICLSNGGLSIAVDKNEPTRLMVRTRREEHSVNVI
jgi:hypothetical protein